MIKQIENVVIVGRSWGESKLVIVENTQTGASMTFKYEGIEELELGAEGVVEYNENVMISFIPALEEVVA